MKFLPLTLLVAFVGLSFRTTLPQLADPAKPVINSETLARRLAQSGTVKGEDIIEGMRQAYSNVQTYQDDGIVSHLTSSGEPNRQLWGVVFKTYFKRPTKFRFEWKDAEPGLDLPEPYQWPGPDLHVIWSDGTNAYRYWEPFLIDWGDPTEKEESLDMAIAGETGVSNGSAHTVPVLLMKGISGFCMTEMERVSLLREESFEGTDCYVVRGFHPFGFAIDLWIGKDDLLLRKQREENDDGTFDEEIRRNVKVNAPIDEAIFKYVPPHKGVSSLGWFVPYLFALVPLALAIVAIRLALRYERSKKSRISGQH